MPRIDGGDGHGRVLLHDERGSIGSKRRYTDAGYIGSQGNGARRRNADAKPGKTARTNRDGDTIKRRETAVDFRHHAFDKR